MTDDPKNENNEPYVVETENDEELGGDSEEVKEEGTEFHRPEQDGEVVSKDVGLPSPSTR